MNKRGPVILFLSFFLISQIVAQACPIGLENDSYPGSCGRYLDQDNNGLCDLSEKVPAINPENLEVWDSKKGNFLLVSFFVIIIFGVVIYYFMRKN